MERSSDGVSVCCHKMGEKSRQRIKLNVPFFQNKCSIVDKKRDWFLNRLHYFLPQNFLTNIDINWYISFLTQEVAPSRVERFYSYVFLFLTKWFFDNICFEILKLWNFGIEQIKTIRLEFKNTIFVNFIEIPTDCAWLYKLYCLHDIVFKKKFFLDKKQFHGKENIDFLFHRKTELQNLIKKNSY